MPPTELKSPLHFIGRSLCLSCHSFVQIHLLFGVQKKGVFALVNKCCLLHIVKADRPSHGAQDGAP